MALSSNEGVSDTAAHDQLVSDFRQGIQNGQFGGHFRTTNDSDHRTSWLFQRFTQRVQFSGQQRACARHVSKFADAVGGSLRAVRSTESVHHEHVAQRSVFLRQFFVVFFSPLLKRTFSSTTSSPAATSTPSVVFNRAYRVGQFVFQVINNRQQREFFVVLAFGRTTR